VVSNCLTIKDKFYLFAPLLCDAMMKLIYFYSILVKCLGSINRVQQKR